MFPVTAPVESLSPLWLTAVIMAFEKSLWYLSAQYSAIPKVSSATQPSPKAWILSRSSASASSDNRTALLIISTSTGRFLSPAKSFETESLASRTISFKLISSYEQRILLIIWLTTADGIYPREWLWVMAESSAASISICSISP